MAKSIANAHRDARKHAAQNVTKESFERTTVMTRTSLVFWKGALFQFKLFLTDRSNYLALIQIL